MDMERFRNGPERFGGAEDRMLDSWVRRSFAQQFVKDDTQADDLVMLARQLFS